MKKTPLAVAFATDDNYVRHAWIAIKSLLEHNKNLAVTIYLLHMNLSTESIEILQKLVEEYEQLIVFQSCAECITQHLEGAVPWGSMLTYGRLFLSRNEEVDRIVYMDCDAVINESLKPLATLNLEGYLVAGVQDVAGPAYRLAVGLEKKERYINAGFLVMNLVAWRKEKIEEKCLDYIKSKKGQVTLADQGTINHVCRGRIRYLPPKYNAITAVFSFTGTQMCKFFELSTYYTNEEIAEAVSNPAFIHLTGGFYIRPWYLNGNHPKTEEYRYYMDLSPWKGNYLPPYHESRRTFWMRTGYKYLPFCIYNGLHKGLRAIKRKINR